MASDGNTGCQDLLSRSAMEAIEKLAWGRARVGMGASDSFSISVKAIGGDYVEGDSAVIGTRWTLQQGFKRHSGLIG